MEDFRVRTRVGERARSCASGRTRIRNRMKHAVTHREPFRSRYFYAIRAEAIERYKMPEKKIVENLETVQKNHG